MKQKNLTNQPQKKWQEHLKKRKPLRIQEKIEIEIENPVQTTSGKFQPFHSPI